MDQALDAVFRCVSDEPGSLDATDVILKLRQRGDLSESMIRRAIWWLLSDDKVELDEHRHLVVGPLAS